MFCPNCGKQVPDGAKFCPNCGYNVSSILPGNQPQPEAGVKEAPAPAPHEEPPINNDDTTPESPEASRDEGAEEIEEDMKKVNAYALGKKLEDLVGSIFRSKGYDVKSRVRLKGQGGVDNEIDLIVTKGDRSIAIECKNYDHPVGKEELMYFSKKLEDSVGAPENALFVTNSDYTSEAIAFGQSAGIEMWDGERLKEEYFNAMIGRGVPNMKTLEIALPVYVQLNMAERVDLLNAANVSVEYRRLTWHPYYVIAYTFSVQRKLPTKKVVRHEGSGQVIVDAFSGEVISTGDRRNYLYDEVNRIRPVERYDSPFKDIANVLPVELRARPAEMIAKNHASKVNVKTVNYESKNSVLPDTYKIEPIPREIIVKRRELLYVPYFEIGYTSKGKSYTRIMLASSGRMIQDDISVCPKHFSLTQMFTGPRKTVAVCEVCGQALCDKHITRAPDGKYYCERDLPEQFREKKQSVFSKVKGVFSK